MNEVLEKARKIACQTFKTYQEEYDHLMEAEDVLMEYLKKNLQDTEAWLLLARIECNRMCDDYDRITHYAGHVLSYDPTNAYALLFLVYAEYYLHNQIEADTYIKLCQAKNDNPEIMAMIELAKARYFESFNKIKYQEALERSVNYSLNQRENCSDLGILYLNQGKIEEGKRLIRQAITNVKRVFPSENSVYDPTSIENFLNEFYAGTIINDYGYTHLKSILEKYE